MTQTGGPPNARQWLGWGDATAATATWRREFPRWPSSQTVARHFGGSWAAALTAAGYPTAVQQFDTTLTERVIAAKRLAAAGVSREGIAKQLGVGISSVYRYLKAGACDTCGQPVTTGADLCKQCAIAGRPGSRWSSPEVLEAIAAWVTLVGNTPSFRDWRPSPAGRQPNRWERDWPRWPHSSAVYTHFSTWSQALERAGFARRYHGHWSEQDIIQAIGAWRQHHNRMPMASEWAHATHEHPSASTVQRRLGRWPAALTRAAAIPAEPHHRQDAAGEGVPITV